MKFEFYFDRLKTKKSLVEVVMMPKRDGKHNFLSSVSAMPSQLCL